MLLDFNTDLVREGDKAEASAAAPQPSAAARRMREPVED
jgi:hypothetical protein